MDNDNDNNKGDEDEITLLYVGGLGNHYQISKVLEVIRSLPKYKLIICCRENEWQKEKDRLGSLLAENIMVVHKQGDDLMALYEQADIGMLLFQLEEYMKIAMPYKTFEYLGYGLPMIASSNTAAGDYIESQRIGWTIPYDSDALRSLLTEIGDNRETIASKKQICSMVAKTNRWEDRALKVQKDLVNGN